MNIDIPSRRKFRTGQTTTFEPSDIPPSPHERQESILGLPGRTPGGHQEDLVKKLVKRELVQEIFGDVRENFET